MDQPAKFDGARPLRQRMQSQARIGDVQIRPAVAGRAALLAVQE